jgi:anti-sigma-K factor RskA
MNDDDRELAAASGAYSLHALDGQEERDFEALLARSPGLRDEVTELTDTAVELALAVGEEQPPADLRARILDATASLPQLPPEERTLDSAADPPAAAPPAPVTPLAWYRRPAGALTAAAAAVVLVAGGALGAGIAQNAVPASQLAAIAAAPDAQHVTIRMADGATARAVWSDGLARSALQLDGLPALPLDRTYQLWYIHGSAARSAGLAVASGDVTLTGAMRHGDTIGVTVEPAGGSRTPTSAPMLTLPTA